MSRNRAGPECRSSLFLTRPLKRQQPDCLHNAGQQQIFLATINGVYTVSCLRTWQQAWLAGYACWYPWAGGCGFVPYMFVPGRKSADGSPPPPGFRRYVFFQGLRHRPSSKLPPETFPAWKNMAGVAYVRKGCLLSPSFQDWSRHPHTQGLLPEAGPPQRGSTLGPMPVSINACPYLQPQRPARPRHIRSTSY